MPTQKERLLVTFVEGSDRSKLRRIAEDLEMSQSEALLTILREYYDLAYAKD